MKFLLVFLIAFLSVNTFAQRTEIIKHDDIFKPNSMEINLDALELWDIKVSDRAQAKQDFENRCYEEILGRLYDHMDELEKTHYFFNASDVIIENSVTEKSYRSRGVQLVCRSVITTTETANFLFELDYSKIFQDQINGTYNLCEDLISEIDRKAVQQGVIVRRVYFIYDQKNGKPFFPKCQTLAIRIKALD